MKAVILAGGLGTRLKPFTEIIPKPLLPIGEKAVLEIQIEHLRKFGFNDIYIATNYKSEYIENFLGNGEKYNVKLTISKEEKPLGTVGPISILRDKLDEPFLVMNGDILTLADLGQFYNFSTNLNAVLAVGIKEYITPFQFGNIFYEGDYVTKIEEKPKIITKILAGIYVYQPDIFSLIPYNEPYDMDTLINTLLRQSHPIAKYEIKEYWLDIGQIDDYNKAQELYTKYFKDA